MNFYNRSMIDGHAYTSFLLFHGRISKRFFILNILFYGLLAGLLIFGLIKGIIAGSLFVIVLVCTMVLIWFLIIYSRIIQPSVRFRRRIKTAEPLEYHFFPNTFKVLKEGKSEDELESLSYKSITKLFETKTTYYMYYGKGQVYVIKKEGFASPADGEAFRAAMKEQLKKLYHVTV